MATTIKTRARDLQKQCVIIDAHNDHFDAKRKHGEPLAIMHENRNYHSDGVRLLKAGFTATCFYVGGNDLRTSLKLHELALAEIDHHPQLRLVTKAADIRDAHRRQQLAAILIWEGAAALQGDIELLHLIHRLGVRSITLTHPGSGGQDGRPHALQGTPSYFGYCIPEDRDSFRRTCRGLTDFGKEVVTRMNQLKMLIDIAHVNDAAFYEVLELSAAPPIFSHGGVFACCPHSRGLTDDQIKALAQKGGLVGIAFFDKFLHPNGRATIQHIVDQMAHVADLVGVNYLAIGSDFDGLPKGVAPVVHDPSEITKLIEAMLQRGFIDSEIKKILGGNFVNLFRQVVG